MPVSKAQYLLFVPQRPRLPICLCPVTPQQTAAGLKSLNQESLMVPQPRYRATRTCTGSCCSAINGTGGVRNWKHLNVVRYWTWARQLLSVYMCNLWLWLHRGLLLEEKPELKRVLEQRRLELHKEEEMARQQPSDLETELRKRQQKLQEVGGTKITEMFHQEQLNIKC